HPACPPPPPYTTLFRSGCVVAVVRTGAVRLVPSNHTPPLPWTLFLCQPGNTGTVRCDSNARSDGAGTASPPRHRITHDTDASRTTGRDHDRHRRHRPRHPQIGRAHV